MRVTFPQAGQRRPAHHARAFLYYCKSGKMADGAPVMFKRKGTRPSQRSRSTEADVIPTTGIASDAAGTGEDSPSVLATKLKNKLKTRTKLKTKLSFGAADEDVRGHTPL